MGDVWMGALRSAVFGAVGGAAGVLLVWVVQRLAGKKVPITNSFPVIGIALTLALSRYVSSTSDLMAEVDKQPTVSVIKQLYPTDYSIIRDKVRAIRASDGIVGAQNSVRSVMSSLITRQAPKAGALNAYELSSLAYDEALAISKLSSESCVSFLTTGALSIDITTAITPEQQRRDQAVTVALLRQTATNPAPPAEPLTDAQAEELGVAAVTKLSAEDRSIALKVLTAGRQPMTLQEKAAMCAFNLSWLRAALDRPDAKSGFVRSLAATK